MLDRAKEFRDIKIQLLQHKGSNLMLAISDDLPGLMVPVRDVAELEHVIPHAIRELLGAQGVKIGEVVNLDDADALPNSFVQTRFTARAEVCAD